jgi:futalosine hydrolase
MASAGARVARALARERYDQVLLFGVGGAWPDRIRPARSPELEMEEVVMVGSERFVDLGVETPDGFESLEELGLARMGPFSLDAAATEAAASFLECRIVDAVTVAIGSGTDELAEQIGEASGAAVENMEGAAVALACAEAEVPLICVRAVSNYVGDRDEDAWSLDSACRALQDAVEALIHEPSLAR